MFMIATHTNKEGTSSGHVVYLNSQQMIEINRVDEVVVSHNDGASETLVDLYEVTMVHNRHYVRDDWNSIRTFLHMNTTRG